MTPCSFLLLSLLLPTIGWQVVLLVLELGLITILSGRANYKEKNERAPDSFRLYPTGDITPATREGSTSTHETRVLWHLFGSWGITEQSLRQFQLIGLRALNAYLSRLPFYHYPADLPSISRAPQCKDTAFFSGSHRDDLPFYPVAL